MFGFEESYGCLVGTHARDKDGIVAVMLLCEAAAYYKEKGLTLWDQMMEIYKKYGYYKESINSVTLKGADGAVKMKEILENIRKNPPKKLGKYKVTKVRDYSEGTIYDTKTKKYTPTNLPTSNVLYYDLEDNAWCCVRPSGTEPKIKFYFGVKGQDLKDAEEKLEAVKKDMLSLADA